MFAKRTLISSAGISTRFFSRSFATRVPYRSSRDRVHVRYPMRTCTTVLFSAEDAGCVSQVGKEVRLQHAVRLLS